MSHLVSLLKHKLFSQLNLTSTIIRKSSAASSSSAISHRPVTQSQTREHIYVVSAANNTGYNLTEDHPFKAQQTSVRSLAQADKIDNLTTIVASLSATQHNQMASLANLKKLIKQFLIRQSKEPSLEDESETIHQHQEDSLTAELHNHHSLIKYAKMDFPLFFGDDPHVWLLRCDSYFRNAHIPDSERIINFASYHMIGEPSLWYHSETMFTSSLLGQFSKIGIF